MGSREDLDDVARGLASGQVSRRAALGRLFGASVGIAAVVSPVAALGNRRKSCPEPRRCGDRCCSADKVCKHGKCVVSCPPGRTLCGDVCVNLKTDYAHCGACECAECGVGQACDNGTCVCEEGTTWCGKECCDPATQNCDGGTCVDNP
jgi:hypothetical protein